MKTVLYPVPSGFFTDFQQWLWWKHKEDARARFVATATLVDPRSFNNYLGNTGRWDHPDFIFSTFVARHNFQYFCDTWQERPEGEAWKELYDNSYCKYVGGGEHCYSVGDLADVEDWEWKYQWFSDISDPWNVAKHHRDFFKDWNDRASKKQRFTILHRDNFRCQLCGRSAQDNAILEVDHVVPQAKGGAAVPWNLWTLCADCNRAKSDGFYLAP